MAAKIKIRPEAKQINPARGQRWRHKRSGLTAVIVEISRLRPLPDCVEAIFDDEQSNMGWKSTVPAFLERWSFVGESK